MRDLLDNRWLQLSMIGVIMLVPLIAVTWMWLVHRATDRILRSPARHIEAIRKGD